MTNRTEQPSRGRASRVVPFAVSVLLALCLPGATSAQWTTSGTNISNTNTGNVGVGTPTPSAPLHVFRDFGSGNSGTVAVVGGKSWWSVNDYERLRVGFTQFDSIYDAGGGWAMGFRTGASDGSGVERLRITSGGNIGIGTASPESRLHVGVSSDTLNRADQLSVYSSAADHFNVARFSSNHSTPVTLSIGVNQTNGYTELQSWTSGVTLAGTLALQSRGGNVGIGTTQPSQKLEVRGNVLLEAGGNPVLYTGLARTNFDVTCCSSTRPPSRARRG